MQRLLYLVAFIALLSNGCGQLNIEKQPPEMSLDKAALDARHSIQFPFSLLFPEGVRIGYDMREYIASSAFGKFDSIQPPAIVFDEIYYQAIEYAHGDLSTACFAAAYGSIEHESIPFDFFGKEFDFPLTNESHSRFLIRRSHLPQHLYHIPEGDEDKVQHFFASAWLKTILGMDWLVRLAGRGVEVGESMLLIGGFQDPRDIHANDDGLRFGTKSEGNINHLPSDELTPNL